MGKRKARDSENPFEHITNRRKHDVLGKKVKGEEKEVGRARRLAYESRAKTLLPEFNRLGKTGKINDMRIGEGDTTLKPEQKAAIRFQTERLRRAKKAEKFNLQEEGELTHHGRSLTLDADFSDAPSDEGQDEDIGELSADIVRDAHFGGGEGEPLTKKEIYEQVIAKSKKGRQERQQQNLEQEQRVGELNSQWKEIRTLMAGKFRGDRERVAMDEYDKLTRELGFDRTSRPSHRVMTTEEMAVREKQRLEMLERDRLKRMSQDEEEEEKPEELPYEYSADGLETNFVLDGDGEESEGDEEDEESEGEEGEEEEGEEGEGEGEEEEGEDSEEEEDGGLELGGTLTSTRMGLIAPASDSESDGDAAVAQDSQDELGSEASADEVTGDLVRVPSSANGHASHVHTVKDPMPDEEIPFTFVLPRKIEAFWDMLARYTTEQQQTVLERMFACNHVKQKDEGAQGAMERFLDMLWTEFGETVNSHPIDWTRTDTLTSAIFQAAIQVPEYAHTLCAQHIAALRKGVVRGVQRGQAFLWPSLAQLCVLRLMGHLFPVTDIRHKVLSPVMLHLAQCLTHSPLSSGRDALKALFVCNLLLQFTYRANRFIPEVFHCLFRLLPTSTEQAPLSIASGSLTTDAVDLPLGLLYNHPINRAFVEAEEFRISARAMAYRILIGFLGSLSDPLGVDSLYLPLDTHLAFSVASEKLPPNLLVLRGSLQEKLTALREKCAKTRYPLQLHKRQPIPMRQFNPSFKEEVDFDSRGPAINSKEQDKRLKRKLKQETKGAIRELRKDNAFLAQQRAQRDAQRDQRLEAKQKAAMSFLMEQEAGFKQQAKEYRNVKRKMAPKK